MQKEPNTNTKTENTSNIVTTDQLSEEQHKILVLVNKINNNDNLKKLTNFYENIKSNNKTFIERKEIATVENEEKVKTMELAFSKEIKLAITEPTIVYVDGVFDIIHSGHFNAIRQAKKLCDVLYVGVNKDEDVHLAKGPTLMTTEERSILAASCKWCDKCIPGTPYTPTISLLDEIGADFAAHGDDISPNETGEDCFAEIKRQNRMKIFKRTEGISTTNLLGRLLLCGSKDKSEKNIFKPLSSKFLSTGWRLREFCNEKLPLPGQKIIYIDGAWDCLHVGHISALKQAKERGDFVYAGLYDDTTANTLYGIGNPVLGLLERTCNLLALRYVDDVVIGAPRHITEDLLNNLSISLVIADSSMYINDKDTEDDPYKVPKKLGIFEEIKCEYGLNNDILVKRLYDNKDAFMKKYEKKQKSEENYYLTKSNDTKEI